MKKKNIRVMYAIAFLQGMVFYASIATLYRKAAGVSIFEMTVIESISFILAIGLEMPWGVIADKIGYKKTMIVCCFLFFISKIVFWKATGFYWFLLERILLSIVMAGVSGVDTAILYLSCGKEDSTKVFGYYSSLGTAGLLIASVVYSVFVSGDYRLAGLLTVITYGIAFVCCLFLEEVKEDGPKKESSFAGMWSVLKEVLADRKLLLLELGMALVAEVYQMVVVFLNQLQYQRCGMEEKWIGYVYILVTVVGLLASQAYRIREKFGEKNSLYLLFGISLCGCICLVVTTDMVISVVCVICVQLSVLMSSSIVRTMENRRITVADRATALSVLALFTDGVTAVVNLGFGKVADISLPSAFVLGAVCCIVAVGCVGLFHRE